MQHQLTVLLLQIPKTGEWTLVGILYLVCLFNNLVVIVMAVIVTSLVIVQPQDPLAEVYLKDLFRKHDHQRKGRLDVEETRRLLKELGLAPKDVAKSLSLLSFDDDRLLTRTQLLRVADFLVFDTRGRRTFARYHNNLTGALIRWGLKRDRKKMHERKWKQQTVFRDFALMTTQVRHLCTRRPDNPALCIHLPLNIPCATRNSRAAKMKGHNSM